VIAVPTDTVYGLVCDFEDYDAINKIFELKKRSSEKPLIAFCNSIQTIQSICENIPEVFYKIADKFFPGPLTIVLKKEAISLTISHVVLIPLVSEYLTTSSC
jgi:L-threonylcarbamoyladenylate synthase